MVFFAVGESMRQAYRNQVQDLDLALERFSDPSWYLEQEDHAYKAVIRRHCRLAFTALRNAYGEASKDKEFRHRNWFRNQLTLASVQKQLENLWDVVSENANDYLLPLARRNGSPLSRS